HVSLMQRARRQCDIVVVSLFVNPLQFGPSEDLSRYPRTYQADRQACLKAGVNVLFVPDGKEFYPQAFQTTVTVDRLTQRWEGAVRPTHFQGVTIVVTKLLNLVRPHLAYFGQKDYQQYVVIEQMVEDLNMPVKIVRCPTVREADGLALSSRNRFLGKDERRQSTLLYHALSAGQKCIAGGERSGVKIQKAMAKVFQKQQNVSIDYLAVCDSQILEPLKRVDGQAVLLGAIRIGTVRLIDNLLVRIPSRAS
ncbi:MAG: pantoate--beta-alanine ligase, partial [Nitrospirales bacterium]|nr:pantoate--beta-alanine ligase [Nitrospirales bacterium]